MEQKKPTNACHQCGATSYRPVLSRAADGAMRPTGQYMCVHCKILFTTIEEWRLGESVRQAA
jgi:transcriptional regulator NrdR family protein